jgi:hypothetical protein
MLLFFTPYGGVVVPPAPTGGKAGHRRRFIPRRPEPEEEALDVIAALL